MTDKTSALKSFWCRIWISEHLILQSISRIQVLLTLKEFCKHCVSDWASDLFATASLTRSIYGWNSRSVALPAAGQCFCVNCQVQTPGVQQGSDWQRWKASPRVSSSLHKTAFMWMSECWALLIVAFVLRLWGFTNGHTLRHRILYSKVCGICTCRVEYVFKFML